MYYRPAIGFPSAVKYKMRVDVAWLVCCFGECGKHCRLAPSVSCRRNRFGWEEQLNFRPVELKI